MSFTRPQIFSSDDAATTRPILVVDDSLAQRTLLAKTLKRWGYTTFEAASGEEAIELCRASDIPLVLSDWMMPGMSGVELCRAYRDLMGARPAYFILLTAQTDRATLAEGLENGADDFLSKPFHSAELKARLQAGERVLGAQHELIEKNDLLSETLTRLQEVHAAVERDLREARSFQQALVPDSFHALPGADITFLYEPSGHIGGDLVGLFRVNEMRYGVYSVDVAGHGVASALMTARIAGHLSAASPDRNVALTVDDMGLYDMHPPDEVFHRLNALMLSELETDSYFTMVLADVDLSSGRIVLAQAGHPSPVIQRRDGAVEFLADFGMPIGLLPDAQYTRFETRLNPGDRLLLYSDGVTECPLPDGGLLEESGLETILRAKADITGSAFMSALQASLEELSGRRDFPDDLSGALIERTDRR